MANRIITTLKKSGDEELDQKMNDIIEKENLSRLTELNKSELRP